MENTATATALFESGSDEYLGRVFADTAAARKALEVYEAVRDNPAATLDQREAAWVEYKRAEELGVDYDATAAPSVSGTLYRVLGTTEEVTSCDCCGRANLQQTVALECLYTAALVYFGTTCAARANRWSPNRVTRTADSADAAIGLRKGA